MDTRKKNLVTDLIYVFRILQRIKWISFGKEIVNSNVEYNHNIPVTLLHGV